jgi:hypothetical protein
MIPLASSSDTTSVFPSHHDSVDAVVSLILPVQLIQQAGKIKRGASCRDSLE